MNIEDKTIWQVAAGNGSKNCADQCLRENVIIGPGHYGAWPDCQDAMRKDGISSTRRGIVKCFAEELKPNDLVVLRVGTQEVYGVGEIIGSYDWSDDYKNVDGWDLQHCRHIRWLWHQNGKPKCFDVCALKFGSSVQHLISPTVCRWLETLND